MTNKTLIAEPLGLYGWEDLEPVILASLITEEPMLLIGKHGSAKSFILERLAQALHLEFRFYNASLINYDDLVGIPVPVNNNTSLKYISNPNSIWDAEVVFIDELNRTKVELQNKLFPIIYEKRVQGINLEKLKYRWAAMNPPSLDDEDVDLNYLGASSLDPALADRFPFIINVPSWNDLAVENQKKVLDDKFAGKHEFAIDINLLIEESKIEFKHVLNNYQEFGKNYIITLMDLLANKFGYVSTRRATMFLETLLAIQASKIVLNNHGAEPKYPLDFKSTCLLHIQNTFPLTALKPISKIDLMMVAEEALKLCQLDEGLPKKILLEKDPTEKFILAIKHQSEFATFDLSDLLTNTISSLDKFERRAASLIAYLEVRKRSDLPAATIESIANEIKEVLYTKFSYERVYYPQNQLYMQINNEVCDDKKDDENYKRYLEALLLSFFPEDYSNIQEITGVHRYFKNLWERIYG